MWIDGNDPEIDDDLMALWLKAVVVSCEKGLRGETLKKTMHSLVDHLSGGTEVVVRK